MVASNGNITAADGDALYLDATTGGFTTTAGGNTAASLDNLIANSKDATLTVTSGTGQNTVYSTTGSGAQFTSLAKVDTVNVTNAHVSAEGMANLTKSNFTIDMGGTGTVTYTVSNGDVKAAANADVYVEDGALSANATKDVTYFEQKNGAITNSTGGTIYETADGKLTTEATTASSSTADPLKALDEAISSIDKFRSSLGAVQNRLDSAVTNLNNTTTNLSEAQSRIQDADYATEVSNMSKAQIIQQAGNSVLAKANRYRSRFCLCCRVNRRNLIN